MKFHASRSTLFRKYVCRIFVRKPSSHKSSRDTMDFLVRRNYQQRTFFSSLVVKVLSHLVRNPPKKVAKIFKGKMASWEANICMLSPSLFKFACHRAKNRRRGTVRYTQRSKRLAQKRFFLASLADKANFSRRPVRFVLSTMHTTNVAARTNVESCFVLLQLAAHGLARAET